jgi:hypothetical protein
VAQSRAMDERAYSYFIQRTRHAGRRQAALGKAAFLLGVLMLVALADANLHMFTRGHVDVLTVAVDTGAVCSILAGALLIARGIERWWLWED